MLLLLLAPLVCARGCSPYLFSHHAHPSPPVLLKDDDDDKVDMSEIGPLAISSERQRSWSKADAAKRRVSPAGPAARSAPVSRAVSVAASRWAQVQSARCSCLVTRAWPCSNQTILVPLCFLWRSAATPVVSPRPDETDAQPDLVKRLMGTLQATALPPRPLVVVSNPLLLPSPPDGDPAPLV